MKKLLFLLLTITLISCSGSSFTGGPNICIVKIKYHISSNCDDSPKIAEIWSAYDLVTNIETYLSTVEIGICVLVNLNQPYYYNPDNIGNVYIINDTDKSWLVSDDCN